MAVGLPVRQPEFVLPRLQKAQCFGSPEIYLRQPAAVLIS
jgi:hypothetical protein